jgi:hypothetical protein
MFEFDKRFLKLVFKYFAVSFFVFFITLTAFFIYSISKLPHPAALKKMVEGERTVAATAAPAELTTNETVEPEIVPDAQQDAGLAEEKSQKTPDQKVKDNVQEYLVEDFKDIRVCQNLSKAPQKPAADINAAFAETITENNRENPFQESWRASLKYVFQQETVKTLFHDLDEYSNVPQSERASLMEKLGFYTRAIQMVYKLYGNKSQIENFANHSYHLSLIAQLVGRKPELAQDNKVLDFCYQIQNSMAQKQSVSAEAERTQVLKLIEYAGLTPQDLSFNPDQYMSFQAAVDKKSFSFGFVNK